MRKRVHDLLQSLGRLRAKVEVGRATIARDLARRPAAPPGAAGAYASVLEYLEAEIVAIETDLGAAEDAYLIEKQQPSLLRRHRDAIHAELYETHAPLRSLLATFPAVRSAWLVSKTPKAPRALVSATWDTADCLRQLEGNPPPPSHGITMDPGTVAADLEVRAQQLETVLDELEAAEARVCATRAEAEAAFGRAEKVAPWVVRALEGLAGLAGVGSGIA